MLKVMHALNHGACLSESSLRVLRGQYAGWNDKQRTILGDERPRREHTVALVDLDPRRNDALLESGVDLRLIHLQDQEHVTNMGTLLSSKDATKMVYAVVIIFVYTGVYKRHNIHVWQFSKPP